MKFLFDIESTGLLRQGSQIHCIVLRHLFDKDAEPLVFDTVQNNVDEGVELLQQAEVLAGHNIVSYDLALLKELYPRFKLPKILHDTLIMSRIFYPNLSDIDFPRSNYGFPKRLIGSHGLEAWGERLKIKKGDFGKQNDWSTYSEAMLKYCIQDVNVNLRLYHKLYEHLSPEDRLNEI